MKHNKITITIHSRINQPLKDQMQVIDTPIRSAALDLTSRRLNLMKRCIFTDSLLQSTKSHQVAKHRITS